MSLALVIPVWNDPGGLRRLLDQLPGLGIFDEVIVVDDASDPPCLPETVGIDAATYGPRLVSARNARQRGAGYSRNRGLKKVTASHVIFFDSDDLFLPEIRNLVQDLEGETFDFCIYRHVDSRMRHIGRPEPLPPDQAFWTERGFKGPLAPVARADAIRLVRVSAYPWNKIYRTAFLREAGVRCTEIMVHNDVEIHWMSFLKATRIRASARLCCEHFVAPKARRLTNRRGAERLHAFEALRAILAEIETNSSARIYLRAYLRFCLDLFSWIQKTLGPEHEETFLERARTFLFAEVADELMTLALLDEPGLGPDLIAFLETRAEALT